MAHACVSICTAIGTTGSFHHHFRETLDNELYRGHKHSLCSGLVVYWLRSDHLVKRSHVRSGNTCTKIERKTLLYGAYWLCSGGGGYKFFRFQCVTSSTLYGMGLASVKTAGATCATGLSGVKKKRHRQGRTNYYPMEKTRCQSKP